MNKEIIKSGYNNHFQALLMYILFIGIVISLFNSKHYFWSSLILLLILYISWISLKRIYFFENYLIEKRFFWKKQYQYEDFEILFIASSRFSVPNLALQFKNSKKSVKFNFGRLENLSRILILVERKKIKILDPSDYLKLKNIKR